MTTKTGPVLMPPLTPIKTQNAAADRYLIGGSLTAAGKPFGLSSGGVRNALKRRGIRPRLRGKTTAKFASRGIVGRDVVADYQAGMEPKDIATKYGCTIDSVRHNVIRAGLSYRTRSEASRRLSLNESAFSTITDESAYWLGFLLADGAIYSTCFGDVCDSVRVNLCAKDRPHLLMLAAFLGTSSTVKHNTSTDSYRLQVHSRRLVMDVVSFGVTPRKSFTATVDSRLRNNAHFWRGVVDGDGCLGWHKCKTAVRPSPHLSLVGTREVCGSLAEFVATHTATPQKVPHKDRNIFAVRWDGKIALAACRLLYAIPGPALARKAALAREFFDRWQPGDFTDWSQISREQLLEAFHRLRSWRLVAQEMGVSLNSLLIYKGSRYKIYTTPRPDAEVIVPVSPSRYDCSLLQRDAKGRVLPKSEWVDVG